MGTKDSSDQPVVLLVEDNDDAAETLATLVSVMLGYMTIRAATAEEGWAVLRRRRVHIVVTDHWLTPTGMTGWELAARGKAAHPALPIVMVSTDPPEGAHGVCDRVFVKPSRPEALMDAIAELVTAAGQAKSPPPRTSRTGNQVLAQTAQGGTAAARRSR